MTARHSPHIHTFEAFWLSPRFHATLGGGWMNLDLSWKLRMRFMRESSKNAPMFHTLEWNNTSWNHLLVQQSNIYGSDYVMHLLNAKYWMFHYLVTQGDGWRRSQFFMRLFMGVREGGERRWWRRRLHLPEAAVVDLDVARGIREGAIATHVCARPSSALIYLCGEIQEVRSRRPDRHRVHFCPIPKPSQSSWHVQHAVRRPLQGAIKILAFLWRQIPQPSDSKSVIIQLCMTFQRSELMSGESPIINSNLGSQQISQLC